MSHQIAACSADCNANFHPPAEVRVKGIGCARYNAWLDKQSTSCKQRASAEKRQPISVYRQAIHSAVERSRGLDEWTGEELEWNRLNNEKSTTPGRRGHIQRARYPSVDHFLGCDSLDFRICSGVVNHAKGALDPQQFVAMCRKVVEQYDKRRKR